MPTLQTFIYAGNTGILLILALEVAQMKRAVSKMADEHEEVELQKPALYEIFKVSMSWPV